MRYINHMAQHGIPAEMRLRRRGDRWRVLEDESTIMNITKKGSDKEDNIENAPKKQFLVFSFYAPWVNSAHVGAHKLKARQDRDLASSGSLKNNSVVRRTASPKITKP